MTYTITTDCASIVLTSDIITEYIDANPVQDFTGVIEVTKNCDTAYSFPLDINDLDILNKTFIITPSKVGGVDKVPDGVYYIKITKTPNDLSSITTEKSCVLVDCDLKCCIIDFLADNTDSNIMDLYLALTWLPNCGDCMCDEGCTLFNLIQDKLTEDGNTTKCGCS